MTTMCLVAVSVCASLSAGIISAASLTARERQHLVAHLEMTEGWLAEEVSGLSPAQLQFRAAPGTWSILEVLEHLVVAEPIYWQDLHTAMKRPPVTRKPSATDAEILWYGIDRTQRQTANAAEAPTGQLLHDARAGLSRLHELHAQMLRYAKATDEDLRGHVVERQGCDAFQWFLLISTHEQRHVLQIREIKADRRFPRI